MNIDAPFTWIVRFDVAPLWVADGGTISDLDALTMLGNRFGDACQNTEIAARVLSGPVRSRIAAAQGYVTPADRFARDVLYKELAREAPVAMSPDHYSMLRLVMDLEGIANEMEHPGLKQGLKTLRNVMNGRAPIDQIGEYPEGDQVDIRGIRCTVRATPAFHVKK